MKIPFKIFFCLFIMFHFFFFFRVKGTFTKEGLHCNTQKNYKELACWPYQNVHVNLIPKIKFFTNYSKREKKKKENHST